MFCVPSISKIPAEDIRVDVRNSGKDNDASGGVTNFYLIGTGDLELPLVYG